MYVMELKFLNCFYVVSFYSTIYFIFINLYLLIGSLLDLIKILKIKNYYINSFCFILNEFCLIFLLFIGQVPLNVIFIMYKIYKQTFKKFLIIFILILIIFFMIISFRWKYIIIFVILFYIFIILLLIIIMKYDNNKLIIKKYKFIISFIISLFLFYIIN